MTVVAYGRVSTVDQTLDVQMTRLKEAGAEVIFAEKRSGSSTDEREELENAIRYLRAGDTFMVTKLDRAARNVQDVIRIVQDIEAKGASFKCLDQSIDTSGPTGRLMLHILAAFAQFELDIRRERQAEGIAAAKARGVYKPKGNETPPQRLSHASRLLKAGHSYVDVAERTRVSVDTLQRKFPQYKDRKAVAREMVKLVKREVGEEIDFEAVERVLPEPEIAAAVTPREVEQGVAEMVAEMEASGADLLNWPQAPKRTGLLGMFRR